MSPAIRRPTVTASFGLVNVVRGTIRFRLDCQPRFNYGRDRHKGEMYADGAVFRSPTLSMTLHRVRHADQPPDEIKIERDGDGVRAFATLPEGATGGVLHLYRVDGSTDLDEELLDHLEGYRGSHPVRIGNAAAGQLQLDIHGEALSAIHLADAYGLRSSYQAWLNTVKLIDWLCENWERPDEGIWETRGGRRNFTFGRLMSWVAVDRAIRLAQRYGVPGDVGRWSTERGRIYHEIMNRGYHSGRRAFVQHYDSDVLDAALLIMPSVGFIAPDDPMWQSTLRAMDDELVSDSLVYRYNPTASPDGLPGREGTFTMCTFWYVEALARSGRLNDALITFEKMLTYSTHLGLFAEEIGPTGEQLGNFPQAFSHLALIKAAMTLDHLMDAGPAPCRAPLETLIERDSPRP